MTATTSHDFDTAFRQVKELVSIFEANEAGYFAPVYLEPHARIDFIDKFWIALGWDVNHKHQTNPYAQEVKVERNIGIQGRIKKADYAFLAPNFRDVWFYVEAKKPTRTIDNPNDYFQTIRYGYSGQTSVSILMDFAHFRVLDCRYKPEIATVLDHVIPDLKFTYKDYADENRFRLIYYLFARQEVLNGSLVRYATNMPKPSGRAIQRRLFAAAYKPVDENFLRDLDEIREDLARSFKSRNPRMNGEQLTEATQRTIDRLVFMRFLEDKLIEPDVIVDTLGAHESVWRDFVNESARLNKIYNGIIFRRHGIVDDDNFTVDEKVFAGIRERLAHTNSAYHFDSLPVHLLGSIYERFLGKVIVTTKREAKVEEKPEVRKAGGVYYTPEYVVRYIVENAILPFIHNKTPEEISELRFIDIACGSGSFLLGIYDLLIRRVTAYYNEPKNRAKAIRARCVEHDDGTLHLSLRQKKTILLDNIYGVDIDAQAVEVAQLSLCLRLLEEESTDTKRQLELRETMLPALDDRIVHGNSIISTDFETRNLYDGEEQERKLHPINFDLKFPSIMRNGGFDAVIGNPPYRRELDYKHLMDEIASTRFGRTYRSPRMDLWYYFVHRGLRILKPSGVLSFIVNSYWTAGTGAEKLIAELRDKVHVDEIFSLGKLKVFQDVSGQHMIFRVTKAHSKASTTIKLVNPTNEKTAEGFVEGYSPVIEFQKKAPQLFRRGKVDLQLPSDAVLRKIERYKPLESFGIIRQGIAENPASINAKTNKKFGNLWQTGEGVFALTPKEVRALALPKTERQLLRPYHDLSDVGRYRLDDPSLVLIYSTKNTCPDINEFPRIRDHLIRFKPIMDERRETQKGTVEWWHLHWPRDEAIWKAPKILSVQMSSRPAFVASVEPVYVSFSINVFVPSVKTEEHLNYITAILNSKLLWHWFKHYAKRRGIGLEINGNVLSRAPIRAIDFANKKDKARHDKIAQLVDGLVTAKYHLTSARTDSDTHYYENKSAELDRQIDEMVYELYGLTVREKDAIEAA